MVARAQLPLHHQHAVTGCRRGLQQVAQAIPVLAGTQGIDQGVGHHRGLQAEADHVADAEGRAQRCPVVDAGLEMDEQVAREQRLDLA